MRQDERREWFNRMRQEMGLPPIPPRAALPGEEEQASAPVEARVNPPVGRKRDAGEPMIAPEHIATLEAWWALPSPEEAPEAPEGGAA